MDCGDDFGEYEQSIVVDVLATGWPLKGEVKRGANESISGSLLAACGTEIGDEGQVNCK